MSDRWNHDLGSGGAPLDRDIPSAAPGPAPPSAPPPGARFMNLFRWVLFAGLLVLAVGSIAGYVLSRRPAGHAAVAHRARYYCPMHPSYTSDKPGECPICGMTLEPIPPGTATAPAMPRAGDVAGLSEVHIALDRAQLIGVRTARVEKRAVGGQLELVGFVAPDEARIRRVQIRVAGWVQKLFANRTGQRVSAGDPLLSLYSPELYQSEREFLIEKEAKDPLGHDVAEAARDRLQLLEVPDDELRRLEREWSALAVVTLRAPVGGTVLERGVTEGQYVDAATPLFTIADLSRVWVLADLYEMDFARVHRGDRAVFTAEALPGRSFNGRVEFIYPTVSNITRTSKLRLSLDNASGALMPGMYGRLTLSGAGPAGLAVPSEAVIHAGDHDYLFVAKGDGQFEPRAVITGAEAGEWVQILRGVSEGDTVVASGSFLIDSESRLKAAIGGPAPAAGHAR